MKRSQSMTLEQCAARMTNLLARKPKGKSRAYFAGFQKRPPVIVSAADYSHCERQKVNIPTSSSAPQKPRADRLRPRAKHTRWHCRPKGSRSSGLPSVGDRKPRAMDLCTQQRFILYAVQYGLCALCGGPLAEDRSLDHCIPIASGGKDTLGNLVIAHGICNGQKSDDAPTGCEAIWLFAVNAALGLTPTRW